MLHVDALLNQLQVMKTNILGFHMATDDSEKALFEIRNMLLFVFDKSEKRIEMITIKPMSRKRYDGNLNLSAKMFVT